LAGAYPFQSGVGIEGGQFAAVGLIDADSDFAAELGELGTLILLLEEPQGFVDHLVFGGESAVQDEGTDDLLAIA
jgi:hypothetical protein